MRISDMIEEIICNMIGESGIAEIQRNEMAERLHCVPSQINYVLSTRFSPEHGYIVESRRGGGGYIRISRVSLSCPSLLMHTVGSIGSQLDNRTAKALCENLLNAGELSGREASLLYSTLSDNALSNVPQEKRGALRARLMKCGLTAIIGS